MENEVNQRVLATKIDREKNGSALIVSDSKTPKIIRIDQVPAGRRQNHERSYNSFTTKDNKLTKDST